MSKKIESANKIIIFFSILLLLGITGVIGYKFYDTYKDDDSIFVIRQINKIIKN